MLKQQQNNFMIICPWCYAVIGYDAKKDYDAIECPICKREIRMEDLEYAEQQED
ncbi:MAG: hypothetical protein M1480_04595 [Bacteroidetes bacterium]|nr:hypothetical protein [Bacteroidota bacterium]